MYKCNNRTCFFIGSTVQFHNYRAHISGRRAESVWRYSLLGAHDEAGEGEALKALVLLQGLLGQEQAVIQNIEALQERRVSLHLAQQPGALLGWGETERETERETETRERERQRDRETERQRERRERERERERHTERMPPAVNTLTFYINN